MNAFEVERILDRRTRRKGRRKILEYRIRWQNFGPSEDTWEPRENLRGCPELLREFEDNLAQMQEADHMDVSSTTDNFGGSDSEEERGDHEEVAAARETAHGRNVAAESTLFFAVLLCVLVVFFYATTDVKIFRGGWKWLSEIFI
ncbi:chromobox protein homolog 1-like isoform X3 [Amblyomma americanum]